MAVVFIPAGVRKITLNKDKLRIKGKTVGEVIKNLEKQFPELQEKILDENGCLRSYVNVFVDQKDIRTLENLDTKVKENSQISIIPAIAGGNAKYNIKELKSIGFMKQKEKDLFSVRLRIVGGHLTSGQLPKLAEIAQKYGRGYIHLTTRQGVEIPYIHFNDFENLRRELAGVGLEVGACGPRVRTITACQGEICSHGLIRPQELARLIDERFFGRSGYPHKFKIGIAGCPNSCTKPYENDFGIGGTIEKNFYPDKCTLCTLCVEACLVKALKINVDELEYDRQKCIGCGECVFICPTGAWEEKREGYVISVGGRMGKFPKLGVCLGTVWEKETLFSFLEKVLEFYKEEGKKGERFGETLERLGLEYFKEKTHPF